MRCRRRCPDCYSNPGEPIFGFDRAGWIGWGVKFKAPNRAEHVSASSRFGRRRSVPKPQHATTTVPLRRHPSSILCTSMRSASLYRTQPCHQPAHRTQEHSTVAKKRSIVPPCGLQQMAPDLKRPRRSLRLRHPIPAPTSHNSLTSAPHAYSECNACR